MECEVEAVSFDLLAHPEADGGIQDFQDDQTGNGVVDDHGEDADRLVHDLPGIAFDEAGCAAILVDGEDAGEERASGTATAWTPNTSSASS